MTSALGLDGGGRGIRRGPYGNGAGRGDEPEGHGVYYTVSAVPVPCGFDLSLTASDGASLPMLGDSQRESAGILCGEAVFGPTPMRAIGLIFELANLQEVTSGGVVANPGPWRMEIPLPAAR